MVKFRQNLLLIGQLFIKTALSFTYHMDDYSVMEEYAKL